MPLHCDLTASTFPKANHDMTDDDSGAGQPQNKAGLAIPGGDGDRRCVDVSNVVDVPPGRVHWEQPKIGRVSEESQ